MGCSIELADYDLVIATSAKGYRFLAGKAAGYLLWCTVCEAARGLESETVQSLVAVVNGVYVDFSLSPGAAGSHDVW